MLQYNSTSCLFFTIIVMCSNFRLSCKKNQGKKNNNLNNKFPTSFLWYRYFSETGISILLMGLFSTSEIHMKFSQLLYVLMTNGHILVRSHYKPCRTHCRGSRLGRRSHHHWARLHVDDRGVWSAIFQLLSHLTPGAPHTENGNHHVFEESSLQKKQSAIIQFLVEIRYSVLHRIIVWFFPSLPPVKLL